MSNLQLLFRNDFTISNSSGDVSSLQPIRSERYQQTVAQMWHLSATHCRQYSQVSEQQQFSVSFDSAWLFIFFFGCFRFRNLRNIDYVVLLFFVRGNGHVPDKLWRKVHRNRGMKYCRRWLAKDVWMERHYVNSFVHWRNGFGKRICEIMNLSDGIMMATIANTGQFELSLIYFIIIWYYLFYYSHAYERKKNSFLFLW